MRLFGPILVGIVAATTTCHSSQAPPHANVAGAVVPYSYELRAAAPARPPFLARFEKGDEELFFIGVSHGCDARTFALIEEVLAQNRVRVVVNEGRPRSDGVNSPAMSQELERWSRDGFCKGGGESGYAAWRAMQHGVSYVGGEPDERDVAQAVLDRGFTVEDLLGYYFIRQVPQLRREGAIASTSPEQAFQRVVRWKVEVAGLDPARADWSFDGFRAWYQTRQGKPFDVAAMDGEEAMPLANGPFFSQKVAVVANGVRDQFMVHVVEKELASEKRVLVVLGASHFATQRAAYETLLGAPKELTSRARDAATRGQ